MKPSMRGRRRCALGASERGGPSMALQRRFMVLALCAIVVLAGAAAPGQAQQQEGPAVGLGLVADDFTSPVALVAAPGGSGRRFIVDQVGVIRVLGADGNLLSQPFLDLRSRIV